MDGNTAKQAIGDSDKSGSRLGSDLQSRYSKTIKNDSEKKEKTSNETKVGDERSSKGVISKKNESIPSKESQITHKHNTEGSNSKSRADSNAKTNKIGESIKNNSKDEKPDEDVPEDFFDDFLKEDFMAGLDIVDEDDEELENQHNSDLKSKSLKKSRDEPKGSKSRDARKRYKEKIDHVKKFRESPPGEVLKFTKKQTKPKSRQDELDKLNAELEEIKKMKPKKPDKSKLGVDADNFDIRRDPEKTRQAIQRDKIKSAKDKEKRLITDIVETGLVPPGMELEVDIEEVRRIERIDKNSPPGDLREQLRLRKTKSKSSEKFKTSGKKRTPPRKKSNGPSKRRKSRSPPKRDPLESGIVSPQITGVASVLDSHKKRNTSYRSAERSVSRRSPLRRSPPLRHSALSRRSPRLRRSPLSRRSPHLRYSPVALAHNSQLFEGTISPRRSQRSPRRSPPLRRRSRSRSFKLRRRTRSRSPVLFRRSRSRDHSLASHRRWDHNYSPLGTDRRRRSRSPKNTLRKEEKMSFLEELAAKLNETHPPQPTLPPPVPVTFVLPPPHQPVIAPVPAPVPPPQSVFFSTTPTPQPQSMQPNVQQFDHYDQSFFIGTPATLSQREQPYLIQQEQAHLNQQPSLAQSNGFPRNETNFSSQGDIAKLFGDQRIKLSDFLAITAKPQVNNSSPAKLQEKIKVIQRCQEAVKILSEKRFTGPLVVHKTDSFQGSKDMRISPLLRKPIIQLPFTTPGLKKSNEIDFTKCCKTLLYMIGIQNTPASEKVFEKPKVLPPKEVPKNEIAPPVFSTMQNYSEIHTPIKVITKSLSTQTDKELSSCKECLRRKGILYANCGVQAGNPTVTFSVSTQVNEADFYSMIPKTQSLASLTPAQLLGKQSMIADHSRVSRTMATQDNMPRSNFQVPSPPPPPIFHYIPPQMSQREAALYSQPLYPSIPSLMHPRPLFGDNKNKPTFTDNRRGGYNNKRF